MTKERERWDDLKRIYAAVIGFGGKEQPSPQNRDRVSKAMEYISKESMSVLYDHIRRDTLSMNDVLRGYREKDSPLYIAIHETYDALQIARVLDNARGDTDRMG